MSRQKLQEYAQSQDNSKPIVTLSDVSDLKGENTGQSKKQNKKKSSDKKSKKTSRPPRPIRYRGQKRHFSDEYGRDIITLYVTCGLGYSPIRMLMGFSTDSKIERVIYQHHIFRTNPDSHADTDLQAPSNTTIPDVYMPIIRAIANKYGTSDHPYVSTMLETQKWYDLPVSKEQDLLYDFQNTCRNCSAKLDPKWDFCPKCGKPKYAK